jgi:Glycosyl transferase family 2
MSKLALVLLTYNRLDYARNTLTTFYKHATPKIALHIADDGSPDGYVDALVKLARKLGAPQVSFSISPRGGYGHSFNLATQVTHQIADYVFMLEDDWELLKPLDLTTYAADLDAVPQIDCIRLGYLSWTQPIGGALVHAPSRKYLLLDPNSPEPHVFAGHPRLERVSYQREVGPWPTGLDPNQTEFTTAHFPRARQGVAWPLGLDAREGYGLFAHIGSERAR